MTTDTMEIDRAAAEPGARLLVWQASKQFEKELPHVQRHMADLSSGREPDLDKLSPVQIMQIGWGLTGTVRILSEQTVADLECSAEERAVAILALLQENDRLVR